MALPVELSKILIEAKSQVRGNEKGELILPVRKRIWRALGPLAHGEKYRAVPGVGLFRRTMLAVYATERVIPIWEQYWPRKDPHNMLDLAQRYIRREVDYETADKSAKSFLSALENPQGIKKEIFHTVFVGYAAVRTVGVALKDEWCDDDGTLDEDRDYWDASFYACGAFTGDFPWGGKWIPGQALRFWNWYIDEAVPRAYAQAT